MNRQPQKIGRFNIVAEIGDGATGIVYEAFDPVLERIVAIKTFNPAGISESERPVLLKRFLREAKTAAKLNHPNIVSIFDCGTDDRLSFIAMERIKGSELKSKLNDEGTLSLKSAGDIMEQLLSGLEYAHARGVIHRDIKPSNIIIDNNNNIKITDFGIAHIETSTLTKTGALLGTPSYMSPEQFVGDEIDNRADIFAAGVLLFELLTGQKPFNGTIASVVHKILKDEPPTPSSINPEIPSVIDLVILKALAKAPHDRFLSARDFSIALAEAHNFAHHSNAAGISTQAVSSPVLADILRSARRNQNSAENEREQLKDGLRTVNVLLVHENSRIRESVKGILFNLGFKNIETTTQLPDIRSTVRAGKADIIFVGPSFDIDGVYRLVRHIRNGELGEHPFLPVIALAEEPTPELVRSMIDTGIDYMLTVPLSTTALFDRIIALIKDRKPYVVTTEYIGPDRRKGPRPGTVEIPLIEVPNVLQARVYGHDIKKILEQINSTRNEINLQKIERHALAIGWYIDQVHNKLEAGTMDLSVLNVVEKLQTIAKDTEKRITDTRFMPTAPECRQIIGHCKKLLKQRQNASKEDIRNMKTVCKKFIARFMQVRRPDQDKTMHNSF